MIDVSNSLSMVQLRVVYFLVLLIVVQDVDSHTKRGAARSTSSSSGEKRKKEKDIGGIEDEKSGEDSLGMTESSESDTSGTTTTRKVSGERKGWRKWHRKCVPCVEDMRKKWRDSSIRWICGSYQRARRSFKSSCMMRFRNCEDGTMFVKIYSGRCKDDAVNETLPHGDHFFYDYKASLSQDSTSSGKDIDSSVTSSESSSITLTSSD